MRRCRSPIPNNSYSAIAFRNPSGVEHGAVGYGNPGTGDIFASSTFIEASTYSGVSTDPPAPLLFVQSGYMNGSKAQRVRQEFTNTGFVNFYRIPTLPLPCCTTNCEPPMVKPWPAAMVEVPVVPVPAGLVVPMPTLPVL